MRRLALLLMLTLLVSCGRSPSEVALTPTPLRPSPRPVAEAFLRAWEEEDYSGMYSLLSTDSRMMLSERAFGECYQEAMTQAAITSLSASLGDLQEEPDEATASFSVTFNSTLLGQFDVGNSLPLVWEEGWAVDWSPELIFPQLEEGLVLYLQRLTPARANIYDRNGQPLAMEGTLVTVGIVRGEIVDETSLLARLSQLLGMEPEEISAKYRAPGVQADWFVPIKDLTFEEYLTIKEEVESLPGVAPPQEKPTRLYPQGEITAHLVGYVGEITADRLAALRQEGYEEGDIIGRAGLEDWGEGYLAGNKGGVLTAITPGGGLVATIQKQPASPGRSIYTSIDLDLQRVAMEALGDRRGAIVAIDPQNGDVLAMVSNPAFDPSALTRGLSTEEWETLVGDPGYPLLNRATQATYPTGSVFKVVTAAAALEEGGYPPSTTIDCSGTWPGEGCPKKDWAAHGSMDFHWAIVRSCDVFFYEMGLRLNGQDPWILPNFGREFGFGQCTGIEGVEEACGLVPDPEWKEQYFTGEGLPFWVPCDAANLAVGQGDLLATPLQVANMMAAIANGGTLYRPRLVLRMVDPLGGGEDFLPQEIGGLPLSLEHLAFIKDALLGVAMDPSGTAYQAFRGSTIPVSGKTGTAEVPPETPHAWFAGYAPADDPKIAVAVLLEHGGEGGIVAAPIFRQVVEAYLSNQ